ncbi:hypothetical protein EWB00_003382 [Schistosoma japonicum]|uniref:Uncharacterized protein n=1 Tax=Schistosoma japonicum TaxID=6182 RepID=A0A4Z2DVN3_SCHJA|nr:hypothetical protein EWB00_003382 [Schistosoma japonicum]
MATELYVLEISWGVCQGLQNSGQTHRSLSPASPQAYKTVLTESPFEILTQKSRSVTLPAISPCPFTVAKYYNVPW